MSGMPETARVSLRPPHAADDAAIQPWLGEAVAAIQAPSSIEGGALRLTTLDAWATHAHPHAQVAVIWIEPEQAAGFIAWQRGVGAASAITIMALAMRRDARNLGYGSEAVQELERIERADAYLAVVPRANGLSVYFWLRTGYRPIALPEDSARARDPAFLWMVRAGLPTVSDAMRDP